MCGVRVVDPTKQQREVCLAAVGVGSRQDDQGHHCPRATNCRGQAATSTGSKSDSRSRSTSCCGKQNALFGSAVAITKAGLVPLGMGCLFPLWPWFAKGLKSGTVNFFHSPHWNYAVMVSYLWPECTSGVDAACTRSGRARWCNASTCSKIYCIVMSSALQASTLHIAWTTCGRGLLSFATVPTTHKVVGQRGLILC